MQVTSACFACLIAASTAAANEVSGSWEVVGRLPQYGLTLRLDCTLQQREDRLSGRCRDAAGVTLPISGEVSGEQVTIGYEVDIGEILRLTLEGELSGTDTMSGRLKVGAAAGRFTAARK